MPEVYKKTAELSDCGTYRYELQRHWGNGPTAKWIMLNPSTADADIDDPTIRKCIAFSKQWGCGRLIVVNLFAFRATSPKELKTAQDPVGLANARYICNAAAIDGPLILAWGANGGLLDRDMEVKALLNEVLAYMPVGRHAGREGVYCLGLTKHGHPKHPLYIPYSQERVPFTLG